MTGMARTAAEGSAYEDAWAPTAAEIVLADAVLAGAAGFAAWEACARLAAPLILGSALAPSAFLAQRLGVDLPAACALHVLAGVLVIPLAHLLVVCRVLPPRMPWWMAGPVLGFAVWVIAVHGLGRLGAGAAFPAMGAQGLVVLLGHVAMGLAVASVAQWRGVRRRPPAAPLRDRGRSVP